MRGRLPEQIAFVLVVCEQLSHNIFKVQSKLRVRAKLIKRLPSRIVLSKVKIKALIHLQRHLHQFKFLQDYQQKFLLRKSVLIATKSSTVSNKSNFISSPRKKHLKCAREWSSEKSISMFCSHFFTSYHISKLMSVRTVSRTKSFMNSKFF